MPRPPHIQGQVHEYLGQTASFAQGVFVAPGAQVIGPAQLAEDASVWFNAVIRADVMPVSIGARTNIQDMVMIHATDFQSATHIGEDVTVGHRAILHGCTIGDRCLIGMGAIVLDEAVIGEDCIVAAGALIPPRTHIPPGSMVMGSPGRVTRPLHDHEYQLLLISAAHYVEMARRYVTGEEH